MPRHLYAPSLLRTGSLTFADAVILIALVSLLGFGASLALHAPHAIRGPEISLELAALPWYALLSLARMTAAYVLSLFFSLVYGYAAARNPAAEKILIPLLDLLQSVPILSFLPLVLLSLAVFLPQGLAVELAAVVLIFTSQVWNLTFCFYQALKTIPSELCEAAAIFRLNPLLRMKTLDLPFAGLALIWNSMMSWSGGWFFLMAAEIFHVGARDFRLPGLGSYLQVAANRGSLGAVAAGLGTLTAVIIALDQLVWRPLLAWADGFKVETVQGEEPPRSWFLDLISRSYLAKVARRHLTSLGDRLEDFAQARFKPALDPVRHRRPGGVAQILRRLGVAVGGVAMLYGAVSAVAMLGGLPLKTWGAIALGTAATLARVSVALSLTFLWTIPVGVVIGTNRRASRFLQPVVQVVASIPATAVFPVLLLLLLRAPGGLNLASILLMLMGTQWYLLFNIIAGAAAIPKDLCDTTDLLRLSRLERWRNLILPALFPYLITGAISSSGGAWNASIVAEHVVFGGETHTTVGVGALIAEATERGDYPLLLASTLALITTVIVINRSFWRRLYRLAEERYRLE